MAKSLHCRLILYLAGIGTLPFHPFLCFGSGAIMLIKENDRSYRLMPDRTAATFLLM